MTILLGFVLILGGARVLYLLIESSRIERTRRGPVTPRDCPDCNNSAV